MFLGIIGEEMLYYLDTKIIEKNDYDLCILHLPEDRKEKVSKYVFDKDKKCCVFGYILVKLGLAKEHGIRENITFDYEKYGKPFLENYQDISVNISHSGDGVICGISDKAVGVDIQEIIPYDKSIGEMILSESEKAYLSSSENPDLTFTELWALKESYVKMLGIGIDNDLKRISFNLEKDSFYEYGKYFEKRIIDNYVISYCSAESMEFYEVTREDLQAIMLAE